MTALLQRVMLGVQEPRVDNHPPYETSAGDEAVAFAEAYGLALMPWQEHVLRRMLAEHPDPDEDSRWAAKEVGLLVARQNGKGVVLMVRELFGLLHLGEDLILHSAHLVPTSLEHFRRVRVFLNANPELKDQVERFTGRTGSEGVEFRSGARLQFMARSESSGRGFSAKCIVMDEAQKLPAASMEAMAPTLLTEPNAQIVYAGTVPADIKDCEQWTEVRNRGRSGADPDLAWLEWSLDPEMSPDDPRAIPMANPSVGMRGKRGMQPETVEWLRKPLGPEGFARECLSIWENIGHLSVIPGDVWAGLAEPKSKIVGKAAFAVDVSPDGVAATVAIAGRNADGRDHVEPVEHLPGMDWVVPRLVEMVSRNRPCAVVVDGASLAASLIPALREAGIEPVVTTAAEMAQACAGFYNAAVTGDLRHLDYKDLNDAVAVARKRDLGTEGRWGWTRKGSADITPLVAATLARFGYAVHGPSQGSVYDRRGMVSL